MQDNLLPPGLMDRIAAVLGPKGMVTDQAEIEPYIIDWRRMYKGAAPFVARPASTSEAAAVVRLCSEARVPIVPQGGNTSLCGGAVPRATGGEIVLSLKRMNRIRATDPANDTITVEAGCILANLQRAAREADRLFPLSLGAEGSCTIGGNLSTNAGGVAVLRYGTMRDLTLGLEVVLPDGRVWDGLRGLRKDNTGYDLKHLFIGAEGTLGVITAAVLKLFPLPKAKATAFAAVSDPRAAVALFGQLRGLCGTRLTGFEIIPRLGLELALRHVSGSTDPLAQPYPWYVLMELTDPAASAALEETLEAGLSPALEEGLALDAVVAASETQAAALWLLRESMSDAQGLLGPSLKHDIAVPVSSIPQFLDRADAALSKAMPGIRIVAYGHIGDGNLHYNASKPEGMEDHAFAAARGEVSRIVYDVVTALAGSISAEHGLGQLKRQEIARHKSALELELMRSVKRALDPYGLMNPGKVLPEG